MRSDGPQLLFTADDGERLGSLMAKDPFLADLAVRMDRHAAWLLDEPVIEHKLIGPRLLTECRRSLARILTLACAYRVGGKGEYALRAVVEMRAAARLPDWNPSHFLDTAELSFALAIGLDWCRPEMAAEDVEEISQALVEKGLRPALECYPDDGFAGKFNNWNFVCNGSMIIAALVVAEEVPEIAQAVIDFAWASLPLGLEKFAPDGAWFEGPAYWSYGTYYLFVLIRTLEGAFGSDFGLSECAGLSCTGEYFLHTLGPTGSFFNFADCGRGRHGSSAQMAWLARQYDKPFLDGIGRKVVEPLLEKLDAWEQGIEPPMRALYGNRMFPLELLWRDRGLQSEESVVPPLVRFMRGPVDVVCMRTSWDGKAAYIGFKGGDNALNHAHLDCGSFVYEAVGERWIDDLGSDSYSLPGYFEMGPEGRRWDYLRIASRGHSVPTRNGGNQRVPGHAVILECESGSFGAFAVADLSDAYRGTAKRVWRGIFLHPNGALTVRDEIEPLSESDVWASGFVTGATFAPGGRETVLGLDGKRVTARIIDPPEAVFLTQPLRPDHPDESANDGFSLLSLTTCAGSEKPWVMAVSFTPDGVSGAVEDPCRIPLYEWGRYARNPDGEVAAPHCREAVLEENKDGS